LKKTDSFRQILSAFQADNDFAAMVQSICLPENLDLAGNVQQNYKQGEQRMNWTKTANIKGDPGNAGQRGSKLTVQTDPPQDSLVDDWNIDPDTGDLYSYEKSKIQFATFDNSTGTLRFWNRETVPSVGDKDPEGHNVDSVFTELNYQNDYQSVFYSIAENLKTAIAVDRVSFTDTSRMFYSCSKLANLDLSSFDTSNVTRMSRMFYGCSDLTLDCSHWNVDKVIVYDGFNRNAPNVIPPVWKN
jgi:surface protein